MLSLLAGLCTFTSAFAASDIPTGTLHVDRDMVRVGTRTQLAWSIQYPGSNVTDVVDITDSGTIIPKKALRMRVRTLGVAFQSGSFLLPIDAYWSKNGGAWKGYFNGISTAVNANTVLVDTTLKNGDKIDFGAQGWGGYSWLPFHSTATKGDKYVTVLKNGDRAPSYVPAYNQGSVTSFLKPFIDSTGKIKIGNRDVIVLWECSTAAPGTTYFDMQDLVILATFE